MKERPSRVLSVKQLSEELGMTEEAALELMQKPYFPSTHLYGTTYVVHRQLLDEYVLKHANPVDGINGAADVMRF